MDYAGPERRNEISVPWTEMFDGANDSLFHSSYFDFNVEKSRLGISLQHIFKAGWPVVFTSEARLKLFERVSFD